MYTPPHTQPHTTHAGITSGDARRWSAAVGGDRRRSGRRTAHAYTA
jgi:hypothetical protein